MIARKVVGSRVNAVIWWESAEHTARRHNILKNYISNKSAIGVLTVSHFGLLLIVVTVLLLMVTSVALAQSESKPENVGNAQTASSETFNEAYRPYLVKIVDGSSVTTTATTHDNPEVILEIADIILWPEDTYSFELNTDYENDPFVGYKLLIDRATPIELSLYGSTVALRTQSLTVAELLKEEGLVISGANIVRPSVDTLITPRMKVSIIRVGTETVTLDEDLDFRREFTDDASIEHGTEIIKTAGVKGRARVTYEVTYHDNSEVGRKKIKSVTLKEPSMEYVIRGTKNKPSSNGPLSAAQIQFLGNCEAGMNPTRNSGNGYYGAFQFSAGTWNAMNTGYARADLAPLDVQIQAVQQLLSRSSIFSQFPGCANQMVAAGLL